MQLKAACLAAFTLIVAGACLLWQRDGTVPAASPERDADNVAVGHVDPPSRQGSPAHDAAAATVRMSRVHQVHSAPQAGSAADTANESNAAATPQHSKTADVHSAKNAAPAPESGAALLDKLVQDDPTKVFISEAVHFHAAVQSETADPDWGPAASEEIRDYLEQQLGSRFEIPVVDCRQDLCELQVAGKLGGNANDDMRDFGNALSSMQHQPWWLDLQFDQNTGETHVSSDGRPLFVWFFSRK